MSGKMPSKRSKTTSYSSTSARVDQQRAKEMSKDGFGFLILQHGQPVTSTSGALLVVERKYSQIEKEFLAAFIDKEPNHQYVFSKKVILRTAFVATSAV